MTSSQIKNSSAQWYSDSQAYSPTGSPTGRPAGRLDVRQPGKPDERTMQRRYRPASFPHMHHTTPAPPPSMECNALIEVDSFPLQTRDARYALIPSIYLRTRSACVYMCVHMFFGIRWMLLWCLLLLLLLLLLRSYLRYMVRTSERTSEAISTADVWSFALSRLGLSTAYANEIFRHPPATDRKKKRGKKGGGGGGGDQARLISIH
ncbi:hypothetical protein BKA80DRAFT_83685 [Phyllosticta citrichinensis]